MDDSNLVLGVDIEEDSFDDWAGVDITWCGEI